jgi:hypothetical protein
VHHREDEAFYLRRISDWRDPLRAARDAFDALGCQAWGDQARRELRVW